MALKDRMFTYLNMPYRTDVNRFKAARMDDKYGVKDHRSWAEYVLAEKKHKRHPWKCMYGFR